MRKVYAVLALLAALAAGGPSMAEDAAQPMKVTLLGTASPAPRPDRMGISTLVEAGGLRLVFDAGRGVPVRMWQLKKPVGSIDTLFITHFHSDHVGGIPDLWMTGYNIAPYGGRQKPLEVVGPKGTVAMMDLMQQAFAPDGQIREADEKVSPESVKIDAQEFEGEGVVYERNGVTVTAFKDNHGPAIQPNVGYRVDYNGHSVVLSGDTQYDENLIAHAKGTDLLIHEVAMARPEIASGSGADENPRTPHAARGCGAGVRPGQTEDGRVQPHRLAEHQGCAGTDAGGPGRRDPHHL